MFDVHDLKAERVILNLPVTRLPNRVIVMSDIPGTSYSPLTVIDAIGEEESADRLVYLCFFPLNQRLFISAKCLLQIYRSDWPFHSQKVDGEQKKRRYSWTQWGPSSSCWFPLQIVRASLISVYGSQFCGTINISVAREWPDQLEEMKKLGFNMNGIQLADSTDKEIKFILDFNQRPFKKLDAEKNTTREPLVWDLGNDAHMLIESQLPFRLYETRSQEPCDVIYMTHFRILAGVSHDNSADESTTDHPILQFEHHYEVMRFYD
jgi:hypothetical protein